MRTLDDILLDIYNLDKAGTDPISKHEELGLELQVWYDQRLLPSWQKASTEINGADDLVPLIITLITKDKALLNEILKNLNKYAVNGIEVGSYLFVTLASAASYLLQELSETNQAVDAKQEKRIHDTIFELKKLEAEILEAERQAELQSERQAEAKRLRLATLEQQKLQEQAKIQIVLANTEAENGIETRKQLHELIQACQEYKADLLKQFLHLEKQWQTDLPIVYNHYFKNENISKEDILHHIHSDIVAATFPFKENSAEVTLVNKYICVIDLFGTFLRFPTAANRAQEATLKLKLYNDLFPSTKLDNLFDRSISLFRTYRNPETKFRVLLSSFKPERNIYLTEKPALKS